MIDEISLNKHYSLRGASHEKRLIATHFGEAEVKIRSASSREKAVDISEEIMHAFESECVSEILSEFLKRHTLSLIAKYWKPQIWSLGSDDDPGHAALVELQQKA